MSHSTAFWLIVFSAFCVPLENHAVAQVSLSPSGFRWTSDDIIFHVHGPDSFSYMGFQINTLGDINADGYDDIAVSFDLPNVHFQWGMNVYLGGNPPDTVADMFFNRGVSLDPHMIDATGDGILDLIVSAYGNVGEGFKSGVFFFRGYGDSLASVPFDSICPQINNWGFGSQMQAALVSDDGWPDLLASRVDAPFPESSTVYYFLNPLQSDTVADWFYKFNKSRFNLGDIGFVDFDGDRTEDIFVTLIEGNDTLPKVLIFLGPLYNSSPDFIIGAPADSNTYGPRYFAIRVFPVGDMDNDSYDDLVIDYAHDFYIYRCGPGADTVRDYRLSGSHWYAAATGDLNGDGQPDLVTGDASFFGSVSAFLGGTEWDVYRDAGIDRFDLPAIEMDQIGYRVAPAGDFNGDGFNDVIFSTQNFTNGNPGEVFVVKGGSQIITDVDEPRPTGLPKSPRILKCYPNPFNGGTTIEFELPRSVGATIEIYDLLGQRIATVARNLALTAGAHRVRWEGTNDSNKSVASGMYFCRLSTPAGDSVKKLIYLR